MASKTVIRPIDLCLIYCLFYCFIVESVQLILTSKVIFVLYHLEKLRLWMPRFSWCKLSVAFRKSKPRKSVKGEGGGGGLI